MDEAGVLLIEIETTLGLKTLRYTRETYTWKRFAQLPLAFFLGMKRLNNDVGGIYGQCT